MNILKAFYFLITPLQGKRRNWSREADDLLREAVTMHGKDWVSVSGHVRLGFSSDDCRRHWSRVHRSFFLPYSRCIHTQKMNISIYIKK